jgi:hypothetical protein
MLSTEWIEHRRGRDGERLGWLAPEGDGFVVIDLLGRRRTDAVDWFTAEETLDSLGIGYLAEPYELRLADGQWLRVRITEVSPSLIRVKRDDWGAIDIPQVEYTLPFPMPAELRVHVAAD